MKGNSKEKERARGESRGDREGGGERVPSEICVLEVALEKN